MIELRQFIEVASNSRFSDVYLETRFNDVSGFGEHLSAHSIHIPALTSWRMKAAYYLKRLLRAHTFEQKTAANLFIQAMHAAHNNTAAVEHILRSENIRRHQPISSRQALRAYQKFELLEQEHYEFVDDGRKINHKELKYMHGLVLKLKMFFK